MSRVGAFEMLFRLGGGGMGEVHLARRAGSDSVAQLVAVKTLHAPARHQQRLAALLAEEARLLALLDTPLAPRLIELGRDGDVVYLAMEYIGGTSFAALRERRGAWPVEAAAAAIIDLGVGLHRVHGTESRAGRPLGLVHRDITPANLLLGFSGGVHLIDFGVALSRDREVAPTDGGQATGTPAYMSPEQLQNQRVGPRSDIWSAGAVLFEILIGERLVSATNAIGALREVCDGDGFVARLLRETDSLGDLGGVLRTALAIDPNARYGTGLDLAAAIEGAVRGATSVCLARFANDELEGDRRRRQSETGAALGLSPERAPFATQEATLPSRRGKS